MENAAVYKPYETEWYLHRNNKSLENWGVLVSIVKPAHAVISIKESHILNGHMFIVLSMKISYELSLFKRSPVL